MKRSIFIILLLLIICSSCRKKEEENICTTYNIQQVPTFYRSFNFKPTSRWVYKNSTTFAIDTLKVKSSIGYTTIIFPASSNNTCPDPTGFEGYTTELYHSILSSTISTILYHADDHTFYFVDDSNQSNGIIQKNIGDSVSLYNGSTYNTIKLENIYVSLTIAGNTFNNVYQMYYSFPNSRGFKRIWWCPNIGFVKFEFYNQSSSQTEQWELQNYQAQLY